MSPEDEAAAREKGRLLAAIRMADFLDIRQRVEEAYGVAYCMERYPEAYFSSRVANKKLASLPVVLL